MGGGSPLGNAQPRSVGFRLQNSLLPPEFGLNLAGKKFGGGMVFISRGGKSL